MNFPEGPAPIEPSSDLRTFAANMRQMFVALTAEGFTEQQALSIIGEVLRGSFGGGAR